MLFRNRTSLGPNEARTVCTEAALLKLYNFTVLTAKVGWFHTLMRTLLLTNSVIEITGIQLAT